MHRLIIGVASFFLSCCCVLAAELAIVKLSMNSDSFDRGSWHEISWDFVDIEDIESFDMSSPTVITIPVGVSRGRCSYQVGLQIPLPHSGSWKVKLLNDSPLLKKGSALSLPFIGQSQNDPSGLQVVLAQGPWFAVGENEIFSAGNRLTLEVFIDGVGGGSYVDARSWLQCEWIIVPIFIDGFESGTTSIWNQRR